MGAGVTVTGLEKRCHTLGYDVGEHGRGRTGVLSRQTPLTTLRGGDGACAVGNGVTHDALH